MEAKQVMLTYEGLQALETELEYLRTDKRKEVAEKIKQALSFGDLSENSEYDEAKNEQGQVEVRIAQLEKMLKNAKVIDSDGIDLSKVSLGAKVKVFDIEYDEEVEYKIVGSAEAKPTAGKISDESPVGKALIGGKVGDTVSAETPAGVCSFKILDISK